MLSISSIEEGKEEWNINGAHIIIPLINGEILSTKDSDKIESNSITLTGVNGDQAVLTNELEHNLVIGIDRNFFESHQTKTDVFIVQNTDLKLLQCNTDVKNSVTYTFSYVDQEKSEIIWESPPIKDKSKSEWDSHDRAVFELKDLLNYGPNDSSKNWQDDLKKTNEQLNLDNVGGDLAQVTKSDNEIVIQVEIPDIKVNEDKNEQFILNYPAGILNGQTVPVLSNSVENVNLKTSNAKNDSTIVNNSLITEDKASTFGKAGNSIDSSSCQDIQDIEITPEVKKITVLFGSNTSQHQKDLKKVTEEPLKNKYGKLNNYEEVKFQTSSSLPEKSLPLKKKAKMKKTVGLLGPEVVKVKQEIVKDKVQSILNVTEKQTNKTEEYVEKISLNNSDSDEPLIRFGKRKKATKPKIKLKEGKLKKTCLVNKSYQKRKVGDEKCEMEESEDVLSILKIIKNKLNSNEKNFNTIFELVDDMKMFRVISRKVWRTLCSGLKEMNVDIMKEINAKCNDTSHIGDGQRSYSPQLKAFALVLYFRTPSAFRYLAKLYKNGWPSLKIVKEWKRQLNCYRRPKIIGIDRTAGDDVAN